MKPAHHYYIRLGVTVTTRKIEILALNLYSNMVDGHL